MRKKLAALLCAVMCIAAFSGCSNTELGYLQMSADMLNKLEVCEASGKVNVDVDVDAMKEYVTDISKAAGYTDEMIQESLQGLKEFEGKKTVVVDYTIKMDMNDLSYYLNMDVTYGGKKYDMGDMYFAMKDGIYVSGDTVWGVYQLMKDMADENEGSYLLNEDFGKELKAALGESKYISLMSMKEMGLTDEEMKDIVPEGGFGDLYASVMTFYKNAFSGFTTNMVSEVSGGYKIQADGKAVAQLLVDLLDYVGNNPDTVLSATTTYMMDVMKAMDSSQEDMDAFKEAMDAAKEDTASIKATTDSLKAMLQEAIKEPAVSKTLDSMAYEATVTKNGAAFNSKEVFSITNGSKSVLKLTTDGTVKAGSGKITAPTTSISTADFEEKMAEVEEKYNPVTGVTVLWGWEGDSEAMLTKERAEESFFSSADDYDTAEFVVEDGRVYLPLRVICEAMGENVEWNNAEKTAYIVRGEEKTALDGIIQDGKSFISVRDFEKLGYKVDYQKVDGLKQVTVSK